MRSNECPKGLAELSEQDSRKVLEGNELARFSIAVFHECRSWKVSAVIENPHSSRLWCMPAFKHARSIRHVEFNWTDFCQDGTPWCKRTAFLSTGLVFGVKLKSEFARTMRQCSGRGACSRTGKPHQPLRGIQASSGRFFTILAEPYPRRLCKRIANIFAATRSEQTALLPPWCLD